MNGKRRRVVLSKSSAIYFISSQSYHMCGPGKSNGGGSEPFNKSTCGRDIQPDLAILAEAELNHNYDCACTAHQLIVP